MRRFLIISGLIVAYLLIVYFSTVVRAQTPSVTLAVGEVYQSSGFLCLTRAHAEQIVTAHTQGEAQGENIANTFVAARVCGPFYAQTYVVLEIGRTENVLMDGQTHPLTLVVIASPNNREAQLFMLTISPVRRDQAAK